MQFAKNYQKNDQEEVDGCSDALLFLFHLILRTTADPFMILTIIFLNNQQTLVVCLFI